MDEELEAELRNPFPSPPSHYLNFTSHNLKLLTLLKSRTDDGSDSRPQSEVLNDQPNVPDWDLRQLEPPRVDWMLESGYYAAFGDTWKVKEEIQSLGSAGGTQLFPDDPSVDRRPHLKSVLRTLLSSYTQLLDAAVQPPVFGEDQQPEWTRHVEWMHTMGQNLMAAANDFRPMQARVNLETMMRRQLELRREETRRIHEKCDALEQTLAALQQRTTGTLDTTRPAVAPLASEDSLAHSFMMSDASDAMVLDVAPLTKQDTLAWADVID